MEQLFVFACFAVILIVGKVFGAWWALGLMAPFIAYQIWHRVVKGYWVE